MLIIIKASRRAAGQLASPEARPHSVQGSCTPARILSRHASFPCVPPMPFSPSASAPSLPSSPAGRASVGCSVYMPASPSACSLSMPTTPGALAAQATLTLITKYNQLN